MLAIPCAVTQEEIESLYKRFRTLDRGRKVRCGPAALPARQGPRSSRPSPALAPPQGFLTADEFLSIPELSINPLAKRLAYVYDNINFKEFVGMLAPYSAKASRDDKLRAMFQVYDVDGARVGLRCAPAPRPPNGAPPTGAGATALPAAPCLRCWQPRRSPHLAPCPPVHPSILPPLSGRLCPAASACAGDGVVSEKDMELILRQLGGSSLSDEEMSCIVKKVMEAAGGGDGGGAAGARGLTFDSYRAALEGHEVHLHVDVPLILD